MLFHNTAYLKKANGMKYSYSIAILVFLSSYIPQLHGQPATNVNPELTYFRKETEANTNNFTAWYFLGLSQYRNELPAKAMQSFDQARKLGSPQAESALLSTMNNLGVVLAKENKTQNAVTFFTSALNLSHENEPVFLFNRAVAYFTIGETQKAKADIKALIKSSSPDLAKRPMEYLILNRGLDLINSNILAIYKQQAEAPREWNAVKSSTSKATIDTFRTKYAYTVYARYAKQRYDELGAIENNNINRTIAEWEKRAQRQIEMLNSEVDAFVECFDDREMRRRHVINGAEAAMALIDLEPDSTLFSHLRGGSSSVLREYYHARNRAKTILGCETTVELQRALEKVESYKITAF